MATLARCLTRQKFRAILKRRYPSPAGGTLGQPRRPGDGSDLFHDRRSGFVEDDAVGPGHGRSRVVRVEGAGGAGGTCGADDVDAFAMAERDGRAGRLQAGADVRSATAHASAGASGASPST